ncbi:polyprenyl synthetase family protein [Paenibacillus planticolens]|uniref:polyprenyl synthetase family protein n=1 Tax=Paenibacillus planticolens TaxID=2654976 RepID=UPI001492245D|nr:polyprenyl synthetase family protein [Paenibacillus planticolens]
MEGNIQQYLYRVVDEYILVENLNKLFKSFIISKVKENTTWGDITLYTHYMFGGTSPDIQRYAAMTELIVLISDIVDDIQDQDQEDKPWMHCSRAEALNSIFVMLMGFVGELGHMQFQEEYVVEVTKIITRSLKGQYKDVTNTVTSADEYLKMTQERSGSLFRLACFMGYMLADCSKESIEQVNDLADCIGLIHQIENDMIDLVRYDVKNDLFSKKRTLPILYLLAVKDEAFLPFQDYYEGKITVNDLLGEKEEFMQMVRESGCMEYSRVVQSICLQKAEEIYERLPALSRWKLKFKEATYGGFLSRERA